MDTPPDWRVSLTWILLLVAPLGGSAPHPEARTTPLPTPPAAAVELSLKVFLEGPFSGGTMTTVLRSAGLVSLEQPYDREPWNYSGTESVTGIPASVVDWILVELRTGSTMSPPMAVQHRQVGFVLSNGLVVDLNGSDPLHFGGAMPGSYSVVIRHRNHLAVMSATEVDFSSGTGSYDFTTGQGKAYGQNAMSQVAPGVFALFAGDGNGVNGISASDNAVWVSQNGTDGYKAGDFNLNGQITAADAALWTKNNGKGDQIPPFVFAETFTNSIGVLFKRPPRVSFMMGSNAGTSDEKPVHPVTFERDFYIGTFEVTQKQWKAINGTDPSEYPDCPGEVDDNCPVEWVTWYDAVGFANALSLAEGLVPCYDATGNVVGGKDGTVYACEGYRLPTEAEWEYVTRAGTTTEYSFGEDYPPTKLGDYAWFEDNAGYTTHPVGKKLPNPWGLYDVHGNVWEWVHDWYLATYYTVSPSSDPQGPQAGTARGLRGGAFYYYDGGARSANRYAELPDQHRGFGLRLAKTIF